MVARGQNNLRVWQMESFDGATITVWSNQARVQSGPDTLTVVACAGLGTPPEAWPTLLAQPERYRVVGAYYRGTEGSPRPDGPLPTVQDHVEDVIALMDAEGIDRAVFLGWSMGVNIACEAALKHPSRVAGVMGVAGVPGDTFGAILGLVPLPKKLRRNLGLRGSRVVSKFGKVLDLSAGRTPVAPVGWFLRRVGMATPSASPAYMNSILDHLLKHDFAWYFKLASGSAQHRRVELEAITQPVTLIGAKWDMLTSAKEIEDCALQIPDCRYQEFVGTHFLPAEKADLLERELEELAVRAGWKHLPRYA